MTGVIALFVLIVLVIGIFWQLRQNPLIKRWVVIQSLGMMAIFFLFAGIGIAIILWIADGPQPQDRAAALTLFAGAWILYGGLWLMRYAPRLKNPPAWLLRKWGIADMALLLLMAGSLGYVLLT